jgi:hypothetical protein
MNNDFYFDVFYFKKYGDGAVTAKAKLNGSVFTLDLEKYEEDGEDPLIKADVLMESSSDRYGANKTLWLCNSQKGITMETVYDALGEFMASAD